MNVFIVHAHPEPRSFCSALKDLAAEEFRGKGHEVRISDLYAMNFNPIGGQHDFKKTANGDYFKYQSEQVNAYQHDLYAADLKAEMDKLVWADLVIFSFPLWWFSVPAILKGWVDRVFAMGFAYGAGKGVYENGVFRGKRSMALFTTGGPEAAYGPTGKNGTMDQTLFPIHHGMLYFVGMSVIEPFIAYSPARLSDEERKKLLGKLREKINNLENEPLVYG
ncbi:MAG: NAD(P)H-dependent oxidoreductase [Bacteroidota bacterium]